jgi:hypothetical protein
VSDRVIAVLLVIVLTALTIAAVLGHGPLAGRELFGVTETHGVHVGDLTFAAAWAVGVACCWQLWRRGGN